MRLVRPYVRGEKLFVATPTERVVCSVEGNLLVAKANSRNAQLLLQKIHGFVVDEVVEAPPVIAEEPKPKKPAKKKADLSKAMADVAAATSEE